MECAGHAAGPGALIVEKELQNQVSATHLHPLFLNDTYDCTMRTIALITLFAVLPLNTFVATENAGFSENKAQAFFSSVQGCEDVVVGVSVVEQESVKPNAPLAPTQAFVFGVFNNICDIGSSFSFADVVTLEDSAFEQKGLNSATLNFTTNIGGFDVAVALDWEGVGKAEKNKNKIHIKNDAIIVHDSDVIASRAPILAERSP